MCEKSSKRSHYLNDTENDYLKKTDSNECVTDFGTIFEEKIIHNIINLICYLSLVIWTHQVKKATLTMKNENIYNFSGTIHKRIKMGTLIRYIDYGDEKNRKF